MAGAPVWRSAGRDRGDLDDGILLAMTPAAPLVGLRLVREAADLLALGLTDDLGGHRRALQLVGLRQHGVAVDDEDRPQLHGLLGVEVQPLDLEPLALLDAVLLAAGVDDCVHDLLAWSETAREPSESSRGRGGGSGR